MHFLTFVIFLVSLIESMIMFVSFLLLLSWSCVGVRCRCLHYASAGEEDGFRITSLPFIYGRNTSGMTILPSGR